MRVKTTAVRVATVMIIAGSTTVVESPKEMYHYLFMIADVVVAEASSIMTVCVMLTDCRV